LTRRFSGLKVQLQVVVFQLIEGKYFVYFLWVGRQFIEYGQLSGRPGRSGSFIARHKYRKKFVAVVDFWNLTFAIRLSD